MQKLYYDKEAKAYKNENGEIVKGVNGTSPYVYYDTEHKRPLTELEAKAYEETLFDVEEEEEDLEAEIKKEFKGNIEKSNNLDEMTNQDDFEEIRHITTDNQIFETKEIASALKLDTNKEFIKQNVSDRAFKNAIKNKYMELMAGTVEGGFVDGYSLSELMYSYIQKFVYSTSMIGEKDSKFKYNQKLAKESKEKKAAKIEEVTEKFRKQVSQLTDKDLDKIGYDGFDTLEEKQQAFFDRNIENKLKFGLIVREDTEFLSTYHKEQVINEVDAREVFDMDLEVNRMITVQYGFLANLLGEGKPEKAYEQFLDKDALQNGEYKYDLEAVNKFIDKNLMTPDEMEEFISCQMRAKDFQAELDKHELNIESAEIDFEMEINDLVNEYLDNHKDEKLEVNDDLRKQVLSEKKADIIIDKSVETNKTLYNQAKLYKNMQLIKSKRPWYYGMLHPVNAIKEYNTMTKIVNNIKPNIVKGTKFAEEMDNLMKADLNSAKINSCLENLEKQIKEPTVDASKYLEANDELVKIQNVPENFGKIQCEKVKMDLKIKEIEEQKTAEKNVNLHKEAEMSKEEVQNGLIK